MRRSQFLAFCALGFVGCFLGGFLAQAGPARALAQYQNGVVPNQVQIRTDATLFIPDNGLRLVNAQNKTLGVIVDQGGNGGIVLLNNQGHPSVMMLAGQAGIVEINAQSGLAIKMNGPSGKNGLELLVTDKSATVKVRDGVAITSGTDGGHVHVMDSKGTVSVRIETGAGGGRIVGSDKGKSTLFELDGKDNEGVLSLFKKDSDAGFKAQGSGSAVIKKDKETLWKIPADGEFKN